MTTIDEKTKYLSIVEPIYNYNFIILLYSNNDDIPILLKDLDLRVSAASIVACQSQKLKINFYLDEHISFDEMLKTIKSIKNYDLKFYDKSHNNVLIEFNGNIEFEKYELDANYSDNKILQLQTTYNIV